MLSLAGVDVLVVMVTNEAQAESVLFGDLGAVSGIFLLWYLQFTSWADFTLYIL